MDWLACGWLVGWLAGWLAGWLVGWLVGSVVGRLVFGWLALVLWLVLYRLSCSQFGWPKIAGSPALNPHRLHLGFLFGQLVSQKSFWAESFGFLPQWTYSDIMAACDATKTMAL